MKVIDVKCSKGKTGFFFDDQKAIKNDAKKNGEYYSGTHETEGFSSIRQTGESVGILLVLEDGSIAVGDCAAVQYSGAGGRDPLFLADKYINVIEEHIAKHLIGRDLSDFRSNADFFDKLVNPATGRKFHTAIRYGVSQALLEAAAKSSKKLMVEVVANEYGTTVSDEPVPIFGQTGDNRYNGADKIIMKGAGSLPHGLINNVENKLGYRGEHLLEYVNWLTGRINEIGGEGYNPVIHIDVYGTIGIAFDNNTKKMADYIIELKNAAGGHMLRIEGPMDTGERSSQAEALARLTGELNSRTSGVQIVADEWCNTLDDIRYFADMKAGHMLQIKTPDLGSISNTAEAVLYCREKGVGAYQGGTCNETDISARACVHVAMAVKPDVILAKPGMGFDEGYMIVHNEMQRILALKGRLS